MHVHEEGCSLVYLRGYKVENRVLNSPGACVVFDYTKFMSLPWETRLRTYIVHHSNFIFRFFFTLNYRYYMEVIFKTIPAFPLIYVFSILDDISGRFEPFTGAAI